MRISDWSSDVCSSDLIVDVTSGAALKLDPPKLPDLTRYTAETAIAKIRKSPRGHAVVRSMLDELSFKGFMGRNERMRNWAALQRSLPQVIFVSGYMTPIDIARQVPQQYFQIVSKESGSKHVITTDKYANR